MRSALPAGFEPRAVCPRCRRAARVCYCAHLPRIETRTRVVILQHPRERDVPIGTAHMASLCLPEAELHVGTSVAESPALGRALRDPGRPAVLLYPGEGAVDVGRHPPAGPVTLVVVDGTWSQAKKIVKLDPELARLPRYAFTPPTPSEYRIRREPAPAYVSTIEALMHVLGALEGDAGRFRGLLAPFRAMVDAQIAHASGGGRARVRRPRAPRVAAPRVPAVLIERARDLVCVVGEANAWPYSSPERARFAEEIVHWVALRMSTGETFESVIAPARPLAPGTSRWVELPEARLAAGATVDDFAAAWAGFCRSEDVLASWGTYAPSVARAAGVRLPGAHIDLREVARTWRRGKVGTLEAFLQVIERPARPPVGQGRGGRRLGQLAAIADFLSREGRD